MTFSLVGTSCTEADSGTITWPSGTTAGDTALIFAFGNGLNTVTGTGFTSTFIDFGDGFSSGTVYSKNALVSGDISSPPTWTNTSFGGVYIYVGRGTGGAVSFKSSNNSASSSSLTLTGFTKSGSSSRVISLVIDRASAPATTAANFVQPSGFTKRTAFSTTYFAQVGADVDSGSYTNNASLVWSGLDSGFNGIGAVYEFTETGPAGLAAGIGAAAAVGASTARSVGAAAGTGAATAASPGGISSAVGFAAGIGTAFGAAAAPPTLARWVLDISGKDNDTGEDIDFTGAEVALAIKDYDGCQKLSATIGNGLTLTSPTTLQLRVTPDQWATIRPGAYQIGAVYRISGATYQIFTGQLTVQDDVATIQ